jgi:hypothetical protein
LEALSTRAAAAALRISESAARALPIVSSSRAAVVVVAEQASEKAAFLPEAQAAQAGAGTAQTVKMP